VTSDRATFPSRWDVRHVAETGSTNADLLTEARLGAPAGRVLVADHQTAGRGRMGRRWEAPPGASLLVSVLLRPREGLALHGATQAVGLAARSACTAVAGVTPDLKWPNDLLVGDRKVAGVLAEALADGGHVTAVVVGLGLNVNWPAELPPELVGIMTSLNHVAGRSVDRAALLDAFLRALDHRVTQWEEDPLALASDYRATLASIGRIVTVDTPAGLRTGRVTDVTDDGTLLVLDGDDTLEVQAGDLVYADG
jgi:BirA family biotin operon repressor/biotin-[acetyl-CoA-carboxylase] ligase